MSAEVLLCASLAIQAGMLGALMAFFVKASATLFRHVESVERRAALERHSLLSRIQAPDRTPPPPGAAPEPVFEDPSTGRELDLEAYESSGGVYTGDEEALLAAIDAQRN